MNTKSVHEASDDIEKKKRDAAKAAQRFKEILGIAQKVVSANPTSPVKLKNDVKRRRTKSKHQKRSRKANNKR